MVVVGTFPFFTCGSELASRLSAQWDLLMSLSDNSWRCKTVVLVRSRQQAHAPLEDLPIQHAAALSDFADRYHDFVQDMTLWGPLAGCRVVQTLSSYAWRAVRRLILCESPYFHAESMSYLITCLPSLQPINIKKIALLPYWSCSDLTEPGLEFTALSSPTISLVPVPYH